MKPSFTRAALAALALAITLVSGAAARQAMAAGDKFTFAVPGIPPVFAGVAAYVAKDTGLFKKYGLDVKVKPMNSGAAAAKAVFTGGVNVSLSPSAVVMKMVSNAGVPLVGITGMEKPDWLIGSMDASKVKCSDMKGQGVGVDSPRGARWIQLNIVLRSCGLKTDIDVPTVNLSSNVGAAMVAGRLTFGVLHLDDIPVIERESGKKVNVVARIRDVSPGTHYLLMVVTKKTLSQRREALVRLLAAYIEAIAYMRNPANADRVAKIARVTGRKLQDAKNALKAYNKLEFWPNGHDGLNAKRIAKTIKIQVIIGKKSKGRGGINPKKTPTSFARVTDASLWSEALALTKKSR